ncbi:MAG: lysylphosphatidylglycerol synthase domain-containing protein, partial [Candidatus Binatia bacterium]
MRLTAFLLGTVLLAALLATIGLEDLGRTLRAASPPRFVAFVLVSGTVFVTYAIRGRLVLRGIAAPAVPSLPELVGFRAAAHAVNFLLPSAHLAGEPVRALLFRRSGFGWGEAFLAVTVDRWIEATASAITGPICIAVFLVGSDLDASWA